eukprot:PhF_6_TR13573/c0_g1_i3/m.21707
MKLRMVRLMVLCPSPKAPLSPRPSWQSNPNPFFPNVRFAVFFSGLLPSDLELREDVAQKLALRSTTPIPTMHVYGTGDTIITPEQSLQLASVFPNSVVVTHDGGHFVPSSVRKSFKDFIVSQV